MPSFTWSKKVHSGFFVVILRKISPKQYQVSTDGQALWSLLSLTFSPRG